MFQLLLLTLNNFRILEFPNYGIIEFYLIQPFLEFRNLKASKFFTS